MSSTNPKPKLLCVHGIWAGGWIWEPWAARFAEAGFEVHTPTLAEFTPRAKRSPSGKEYVAALAKRYHLGPNDWLMGHSGGSILSLALAEQLPRLGGLVLLCPAPPRWSRPALSRPMLRHAPKMLRALMKSSWVGAVNDTILDLGMNVLETERHQEVLDQHGEESRRYLLELGLQRFGFDREKLPRDILVVAAREDRTIPLASVLSTAQKLDAPMLEIGDAGHYLPIEKNGQECQDQVLRWMEDVKGSGYAPQPMQA